MSEALFDSLNRKTEEFLAQPNVKQWSEELRAAQDAIESAKVAYSAECTKGRALADELASKRAELAELKSREAEAAGEAIVAGEARTPDSNRTSRIRGLEDRIPALEAAIKIQTSKSEAAYHAFLEQHVSTIEPGTEILAAWREAAAADFAAAWVGVDSAINRLIIAASLQEHLLGKNVKLPFRARRYEDINQVAFIGAMWREIPHSLKHLVNSQNTDWKTRNGYAWHIANAVREGSSNESV